MHLRIKELLKANLDSLVGIELTSTENQILNATLSG